MGKEIERKFLLTSDDYRQYSVPVYYRQAYLSVEPERTVRVRVVGDEAFLTIKGKSDNATRTEFEYKIPLDDAIHLLDHLCKNPIIEKHRYKVPIDGLVWEIDEFYGENEGLIVAELELQSEDQPFQKPEWVGKEVTGDPRYFNANLIKHPFKNW